MKFQRFPYAARTLVRLLALLCCAAPAAADGLFADFYKLDCKLFGCGYLEASPSVFLVRVDPNPMPTVPAGAPQTITAKWSVKMGLKTRFELCLTGDPSATQSSQDPCVPLTGSNILSVTTQDVVFEETVTIPGQLRRPQASFYIRSTSIVGIFRQPPAVKLSNLVAFTWPIPLPNLRMHGVGINFYSSGRIEVDGAIEATGSSAPGNVEVAVTVAVCDGNTRLPQRPGSTRRDDVVCIPSASGYVTTITVPTLTVPATILNRSVGFVADITSLLPAAPANLWLTPTAVVDPANRISESNESAADNSDDGTVYVPRP